MLYHQPQSNPVKTPIFTIFCWLFLLGGMAFGSSDTDSLTRALQVAPNDTTRIRLLNALSLAYRSTHRDTALQLSRQALAEAREIGEGIFTSLNQLGMLSVDQGAFQKALKYYEQAQLAAKDSFEMAQVWHNIGGVYRKQGELDKALEYILKSLQVLKQQNDQKALGHGYNSIANIYHNQGNYPRALEYYEAALALQTQAGNQKGIARQLYNLGILYYS